jgi:signal transduction histidine kinase
MHRSDELEQVAASLFEAIVGLGIAMDGALLFVFDRKKRNITLWVTIVQLTNPVLIDLPYEEEMKDNEIILDYWKATDQGQALSKVYTGETKNEYFRYVQRHNSSKISEQAKKLLIDLPAWHLSFAAEKNTMLGLDSWSGHLFTESDLNTLRKFVRAFEQAYVRFLDLQKAEAQAREAQIQLSLERIRAKAMSMQQSDELSGFLTVLFEQFAVLNLSPVNCHLHFFDIDNNRSTFRLTGKNGSTLIATQEIDLNASPAWKQKVEDLKSGHPKEVDSIYIPYENISEIGEIFKEILEKLPEGECPLPEDYPNGEYITEGYCKYGYLGYSASRPPSDEEKEITRRIANEFGNVYQRFLDLQKAEAQAREAQIENALEKVRSRTMAMQHSDELTDVAGLLFNQVSILGIKTWTTGFNVWSEDNNSYVDYLSFGEGFIEPNTVHTEKAEALRDVSNARKSGVEFDVLYVEGEKLKQLYLALTNWDEKQYEKLLQDGVIQAQQYEHFVFGSRVSLMFITYEPVPEAHDIFKRLGKVFEQTYTRFLDLQKAEAQAREAQIEAALERVRSRTMAMHNSQDVDKTVIVLFDELIRLGVDKSIRSGIGILSYSRKMEVWTASTDKLGKTLLDKGILDMRTHPLLTSIQQAWEAKKATHSYLLAGDDLKNYFKTIHEAPEYSLQVNFKELPESYQHYDFYFPEGFLFAFSLDVLSEEVQNIFKRFAAVFGQTYRRFLDLQKAEAQAREAQIEAALERVRSRSMAMHKSEELYSVVNTLYGELQSLQVNFHVVGIQLIPDDSKDLYLWLGTADGLYDDIIHWPYTDIPVFHEIYEARTTGKFMEFTMSETTTKEFFDEYFKLEAVPKKRKTATQNVRLIDIAGAYQKLTGIFLMRYSVGSYSQYEKDIVNRFSKAFEQTYTRFLDLQKAEAQAREAQIEAALERVRSKAMAMHNSEDLNATVAAFYRELEQFSITPRRCGVGLLQKNRIAELSTMNTMEHGNSIEIIGILKMEGHWVLDGVYDNWILQKEFHPVLRGNEIKEYNQLLRPQVAFPEYTNDSAQFGYFFFFPEGGVYAWTEKEMKEDELNIYRRFTRVLSLTYKRYKDLKDAEANALEAVRRASLDRVRAEIASMRTVDDLQRITPIIWHELTALGVPFVRCGVFIIDEATKHIQVHLSSPDGSALGALDLPFNSSELTLNSVNHWRQGIIFKTHWNKQEFLNFMQSMIKLGQINNPETYQGATQPPESLHLHFVPFKQGMLYAGNTSPLEKEALELVKALAESFSIAYARYEDFKQLQTAKNQIEKTFTELKAAQNQLIQAEKMASLGELTAGIAHEIQNPLNFVNNFSEISNELIVEIEEERARNPESRDENLVSEVLSDIKQNLQKINHHGKRAADIVKGMLQHSRTSTGQKEPTDINALADEYLRLAYHGLRAKDKSFNATMKTDFDERIGKINVIPQDIGRVILNLITNAFYVVDEKKKQQVSGYDPTVSVSTKKDGDKVLISVQDNGSGIPQKVLDKIFQPFFTTKPTGQGTGLGLSLAYDIVKAHGGELKVETKEGEKSEFIILLPV